MMNKMSTVISCLSELLHCRRLIVVLYKRLEIRLWWWNNQLRLAKPCLLWQLLTRRNKMKEMKKNMALDCNKYKTEQMSHQIAR